MPRRNRPAPRLPGEGDPSSLGGLAREYFEDLRVKNYAEATVEHGREYLRRFILWAHERGLSRAAEITKPILERYQRHLFHYRKRDGRPLSFRSQRAHLVPLKSYFRWLVRHNHLLYNPASELELPKLERRLPKHILTAHEAELVLGQPDLTDPLGLRDRAMLEVLYSTGMRRMELVTLTLFAVDVERGTVMIRQGKGRKDRMVPIGERALAWVQKYLDEVRPKLVLEPDDGTLFLTRLGEAFAPAVLSEIARRYIDAAEIGKRGSCHLFRHTMATLMLEGGADIRFIQAMLGHVELSTTQIYTQVSIKKLKEIHTATHPGAKLERRASSATSAATEEAERAEEARAELVASLAAEAEEEHDHRALDSKEDGR